MNYDEVAERVVDDFIASGSMHIKDGFVLLIRDAIRRAAIEAAWWTFATQALRVAWLAIGVGELMHGSDLVLVIAAYGFPAAVTVGVMRAMEKKRG